MIVQTPRVLHGVGAALGAAGHGAEFEVGAALGAANGTQNWVDACPPGWLAGQGVLEAKRVGPEAVAMRPVFELHFIHSLSWFEQHGRNLF